MESFVKKGRALVSLAPMANFSDSPYRLLCRRHGASFSFSEFISTDALSRRDPGALNLLRFEKEERPIVFQIFGNSFEKLLHSARYIEELEPDGIDINMGCSVKYVANKGSGAGMLRDPVKTGKIFEGLSKSIGVPISAKIRLGWDDKNRNYLEVARILQESGAAFLSVHGRTKHQGYKGVSDWISIGEISSEVSIPVFGNGDVESRRDALDKIKKYDLAGVLIGRAAVGNPFIFNVDQSSNSSDKIPTIVNWVEMMLQHLDMMLLHYSDMGLILFRKHAARYLKKMNLSSKISYDLLTTNNVDNFRCISLDLIDNKQQPPIKRNIFDAKTSGI